MSKFNIVFLALLCSSAAFAEPVLYVCERPAWEGKKAVDQTIPLIPITYLSKQMISAKTTLFMTSR